MKHNSYKFAGRIITIFSLFAVSIYGEEKLSRNEIVIDGAVVDAKRGKEQVLLMFQSSDSARRDDALNILKNRDIVFREKSGQLDPEICTALIQYYTNCPPPASATITKDNVAEVYNSPKVVSFVLITGLGGSRGSQVLEEALHGSNVVLRQIASRQADRMNEENAAAAMRAHFSDTNMINRIRATKDSDLSSRFDEIAASGDSAEMRVILSLLNERKKSLDAAGKKDVVASIVPRLKKSFMTESNQENRWTILSLISAYDNTKAASEFMTGVINDPKVPRGLRSIAERQKESLDMDLHK